MQTAMAWSKKNWLIVASVALPVLAVPAMVYFALSWNSSVVTAAQTRIDSDMKTIKTQTVTYKLPGIKPEDPSVDFTGAPNQVAIDAFKAARAARMAAANSIVSDAVAFNRGSGKDERKPLVEGLFPEPPAGNASLQREMARRFNREAQERLLKSINAQPPVAGEVILARLNTSRDDFLKRLGVADTALTPEQQAALQKQLVGVRMDAYASHASKVLTYGDIGVFVLPTFGGEASVPSLAECWEWQMQYWIQSDLIRAIGKANESAKNLGVTVAPVKRIDRIAVLPAGDVAIDPSTGQPMVADGPDWTLSFTGRRSDSNMDVRKAEMTVVVAAGDLPKLIDAISQTNLMTVTSVRLAGVDLTAELSNGYFYGPVSVVRATLTIETVWLKEWINTYKPKDLSPGSTDPTMPSGAPGAPVRGGA